jgi:hypothetical protein
MSSMVVIHKDEKNGQILLEVDGKIIAQLTTGEILARDRYPAQD